MFGIQEDEGAKCALWTVDVDVADRDHLRRLPPPKMETQRFTVPWFVEQGDYTRAIVGNVDPREAFALEAEFASPVLMLGVEPERQRLSNNECIGNDPDHARRWGHSGGELSRERRHGSEYPEGGDARRDTSTVPRECKWHDEVHRGERTMGKQRSPGNEDVSSSDGENGEPNISLLPISPGSMGAMTEVLFRYMAQIMKAQRDDLRAEKKERKRLQKQMQLQLERERRERAERLWELRQWREWDRKVKATPVDVRCSPKLDKGMDASDFFQIKKPIRCCKHERLARLDAASSSTVTPDTYSDRSSGRSSAYTRRENRLAALSSRTEDDSSKDYRKLYENALSENQKLKSKLQDAHVELSDVKSKLDKLAQVRKL
ncbi:hypothetical protein lerEdw1_009226 [Lerista edwardsae]|nr:hypothetical protein lerEdw1_009226 [Lerista edwardsae]